MKNLALRNLTICIAFEIGVYFRTESFNTILKITSFGVKSSKSTRTLKFRFWTKIKPYNKEHIANQLSIKIHKIAYLKFKNWIKMLVFNLALESLLLDKWNNKEHIPNQLSIRAYLKFKNWIKMLVFNLALESLLLDKWNNKEHIPNQLSIRAYLKFKNWIKMLVLNLALEFFSSW